MESNTQYPFFVPVGRPRLPDVLAPNYIARKEEYIVWKPWGDLGKGKYRPVSIPDDILDRFLGLSDPKTSDDDIYEFARKFGVLGLCRHGLPMQHRRSPSKSVAGFEHCPPAQFGESARFKESIADWRALAKAAAALLTPQRTNTWKAEAGWLTRRRGLPVHGSTEGEIVATLVNDWILCGGVRPMLLAHGAEYRAVLLAEDAWFPNLFARIAAALFLAVFKKPPYALCDGIKDDGTKCGQKFKPLRQGNNLTQRRHFCKECRENKRPRRSADKARADRKRRACELWMTGMRSYKRIVQELRKEGERMKARRYPKGKLMQPEEMVKRWIEHRVIR